MRKFNFFITGIVAIAGCSAKTITSPSVVPATEQEAMSVAWLQDRSFQIDRVIASVTSNQNEQRKIFDAIRSVRSLDQATERLLSDVRNRTRLIAPVWSANAVWVENK